MAPIRVLLIEDDPDDQFLVRDLLSPSRNADFDLDTHADAESGWRALESGGYDVCLLDHFLGGTLGIDLIRDARAAGISTPIIMLTGAADDEVDHAARAAGAADFLEKARIDARTLGRTLRYAVARHAAEGKLRMQSHLLESVREAIFAVDVHGTILYWNRFAAELYGWSVEDAVGHDMHEVTPMQAEHLETATVRETLRRGAPWTGEFEVVRRDGSHFWASVLNSPIVNDRGELIAIVGISVDVTERRAAIQELRASEERLKVLFESAPDAIFVTDVDGAMIDTNRMAETLTGYRREEMVGRSLITSGIVAQKDMVRALAALGRIARGQPTGPTQYDMRRRDGTLVPVEVRTYPVEVHGRRLVMGIARDVTERRRAEDALRASEQRFRALVEHTAVGVWQLSPDGFTQYVNPAMCDMLEVTDQGALAGQRFNEFFTPESVRVIERQVGKRAHGLSTTYEVDLVGGAGTRRRVLISGAPLMGTNGELLGTMAAIIDITGREAAERARAASEQKFATAFQASPRPMAILTKEFEFLDVNEAFVTIFGFTRDALIGRRVEDIKLWTDAEHADAAHAALLHDGHVRDWEATLRTVDGELRTGLYSARIIDIDGRPHVLGQFDDQTERRALQEQLGQAQKMESIGRLAGGVAHDFNNILTAILGNADLLLAELPADAPVRVDLEEIRDGAKRAAALTSQLLAFSRKQMMVPEVLDLNAVVREMERMLRRLIGEDIELVTALDPALGAIEADPGQLQQIVMNLAVNARDAMPEGGRLDIATANVTLDERVTRVDPAVQPGEYVRMTVGDSGEGMTPEVQAQIFEPFFTTKPQGKGTGLGLSTVYGIVKQNAGHITVESAPGIGTTFAIYLPRVRKAVGHREDSPASRELRGHETVLVVEDDDGVRALTSRVLMSYGYDVLEARDATDAERLCLAHRARIRVMVTDVIMPGESGTKLADRIRRHLPALPILFISGYTGAELAQHGALGPDIPFLQKPFTPQALAAKLRDVLDAV